MQKQKKRKVSASQVAPVESETVNALSLQPFLRKVLKLCSHNLFHLEEGSRSETSSIYFLPHVLPEPLSSSSRLLSLVLNSFSFHRSCLMCSYCSFCFRLCSFNNATTGNKRLNKNWLQKMMKILRQCL